MFQRVENNMNRIIKNEVYSAIERAVDIRVVDLKRYERDSLFQDLLTIFTKTKRYKYPLWDNVSIKSSLTLKTDDVLKEIILSINGEIILFFEPDSLKNILCFEKAADVIKIIFDCFPFVFYLTNKNLEFLYCFDDSDSFIEANVIREL